MISIVSIYLLKSIIISMILILYYLLFLRNKKINQYNRFYLLALVTFSLLAPLIKLPGGVQPGISELSISTLNTAPGTNTETLSMSTSMRPYNNIDMILCLVYLLVTLILLVRFSAGFVKLMKMVRSRPRFKHQQFTLVNTDSEETPCSFFHYILWNSNIELNSPEGQQIIAHEMVHIREKHSVDKIFLEIVTALCWFNPFFHFVKKELGMIHEFTADNDASGIYGEHAYAELLLLQQFEIKQINVVNYFYQSQIKRRIIMLTKNQNQKMAYTARVLALPLFMLAFVCFANGQSKSTTSERNSKNEAESVITKNEQRPTHYKGKKIISIKVTKRINTTQQDNMPEETQTEGHVFLELENNENVVLNFDEAAALGIQIPPTDDQSIRNFTTEKEIKGDLPMLYDNKKVVEIKIKENDGEGEARLVLENGEKVTMSLEKAKSKGFYEPASPPSPPSLPSPPSAGRHPSPPSPPSPPDLPEYYKGKKIMRVELKRENENGSLKLKLEDGEEVNMNIEEAKKEGLIK
jgi:beta-lactamase regulating signal transducer with metallopeptidase domain